MFKMKKGLAVLMLSAIAAMQLTGCSKADKKAEVNLYTWSAYVPDSVIERFEQETGIKVNYANFESNEEMLSKLQTAKGGDYDLIIASDYIVKIASDEGLIKDIDQSKVPNFTNIDPIYQGFFYDPSGTKTVPYAPGIPLIVYNPNLVDTEITGYESLWDPSLKGSVALMDNERVIMGMALKTMGESFNTEDLSVIRAAGDKLMDLADNVRLLSIDQTHEYLLSEEAGVAFLYTSQVLKALQGNPDLKVVYPEEGIGFGVDAAFIPVNAPNNDNAHALLNFILDGETGAEISMDVQYLCPNKAAYEYIPEEYKQSLIATPDAFETGEFITDISAEATELHNELWTEFKSKLK